MIAYRRIIERFSDAFRFLCWDARGLFGSSLPARGAQALRIEDHVADLLRLVEVERVQPAVIGGWSMGVQISLEFAHRRPDLARALVLINGAYGAVLRGADFGIPGGERSAVALVRALSHAGPALGLAARLVLDRAETLKLMRVLGVAGGRGDEDEFFLDVAREFKRHDFGLYLQMLLNLHRHTAEPLLAKIDLPTLVTCGTRDKMTPPAVARELARKLRRAELVEIAGGTHYTMMEYPEELNRALERFLRAVAPEAMQRVA
jgi:pimeloyl-ACP methyl ester carboxylesterase